MFAAKGAEIGHVTLMVEEIEPLGAEARPNGVVVDIVTVMRNLNKAKSAMDCLTGVVERHVAG